MWIDVFYSYYLPIVRQHQMVNEFLKEDIAKWHGIQLTTKKVRKPKD